MKTYLLLLTCLALSAHARHTDVYTNIVHGISVVSEYQAHDNLDYGVPGTNVDVIVDRDGYAIGFSNEHHQPIWASYRLTKKELTSTNIKRSNDFRTDTLIAASSTPGDYSQSGYDRGHLVPAADMSYSSWTMHSSFLMSNMSPQVGGMNREGWRLLETWVRDTAMREGSIVVVTGPIIFNSNTNVIGQTKVTIPEAFYKVILDETPPCKVMGFVMLNQPSTNSVKSYVSSILDLERETGLKFFEKFPNIKTLKENQDTTLWTW